MKRLSPKDNLSRRVIFERKPGKVPARRLLNILNDLRFGRVFKDSGRVPEILDGPIPKKVSSFKLSIGGIVPEMPDPQKTHDRY